MTRSCNGPISTNCIIARTIKQSLIVFRKYLLSISDLHRLSELQEMPLDLDPYVKKLMNSRRRIMLVNNILQNAQVL